MTAPAATKQINVRIPAELHAALADHKETTGEDKSDVVRRGIELALGIPSEPPPAPGGEEAAAAAMTGEDPAEPENREGSGSGDSTSDSSTASAVKEERSIDLAGWLAGRTGMPKALCRRALHAGRVAIDGRVYEEDTAPAAALQLVVTLDGNPL